MEVSGGTIIFGFGVERNFGCRLFEFKISLLLGRFDIGFGDDGIGLLDKSLFGFGVIVGYKFKFTLTLFGIAKFGCGICDNVSLKNGGSVKKDFFGLGLILNGFEVGAGFSVEKVFAVAVGAVGVGPF